MPPLGRTWIRPCPVKQHFSTTLNLEYHMTFGKKQYPRFLLLLILITFPFYGAVQNDRSFEITKNLDIYYTLYKELDLLYVDEIDPGKLIKTSIDEMLESLDPYTVYIPESKMEDFRFMTTGQYGGIGAMIRHKDKHIVITELYEGFPAHKAGLKTGDVITAVEGKTTEGKTTSDISTMLKGQPNTSIVVTIKRPGTEELLNITVTREEIKIKSVPYYGMIDDKIGYITLSSFTESAGREVKEAFLDLKKQGMESLVFDLRNNPGGLLMESVKIVNFFVEAGQEVVSTKGKYRKNDKIYSTSAEPLDTEIPITVLVNGSSASASEIVSGALQDLDRAVVIGQRSFGKGLVQTTRDLSYNTKLKVTTAKYYIPSGRCIQALDYSHRKKNGKVEKVADSLISAFKTKGGRPVFDGKGINPDLKVAIDSGNSLLFALIEQDKMFDYVTELCIKKEFKKDAHDFEFTDSDFEDFKTYLTKTNFTFKTVTEKEIEELKKTASAELGAVLAEKLTSLQATIDQEKELMLDKNKKLIKEYLASEIMSRVYFQKGKIIAGLKNDDELKYAKDVLNNNTEYKAYLEGTKGEHKIK